MLLYPNAEALIHGAEILHGAFVRVGNDPLLDGGRKIPDFVVLVVGELRHGVCGNGRRQLAVPVVAQPLRARVGVAKSFDRIRLRQRFVYVMQERRGLTQGDVDGVTLPVELRCEERGDVRDGGTVCEVPVGRVQ